MTTTSAHSASRTTGKNQTPKGLGEAGRQKWFEMSAKVVNEPKNLELLALACSAWEDWVKATELITESVIDGTGGTQKTHPAAEQKLSAMKLYRQLLKDIQWLQGDDDEGDGRPDDIDE